jgi:fibronectin type 3 domain-containing protein
MYNALSKAKRMVSEALRLWPSYEKGKEAEAKIQKELQKIKPLEEKCEKALSRKCLMDAKVALSELEKAAIDHPLLEKKEMVESQIASADELVQKAKATIDLRAKEKLLLEALAISSQCVEPRDMPLPAPPSDLKMSVGQSNIHLSWQASPSIGNIRYRVMRKENGHPNSPEDGKELATVDILNYTDSGITPGVSYYYAVYSVRQNSFSSERQTAGPAIQVAGVSDFKAVSGNKMVTLKWKAPKASVVTIRRKEKNAADSSEIVLCEGFSGEEFVDAKNVENETFYTYTVQTFFSNGQSGSQASYTVCPTLPPTPIIDLKIAKENQAEPQKRVLSWTPAASNTVTKIVQTQSKLPDCNEGQFYTLSEANAWGKTVSILKEGFAEPMLESGMNYFIPLTIKGDAVVCGKIASVPYVQGLQNVIGDGIDDTVTLRWQWPTGVKNALITYAYDAFPQEPSPQSCAASEEVMGKEDSSSCETKFCVSQKCPHYFSVFAYVSIGGKKYFSLPSKVQVLLGNVPIISYRIVKKGLFKQRFYVELRSDPADEFALPDLQLRVKASEVPFDQTDGVLLSNVSNVTLQNGHALIDVPESESKSGRYLKIFFKDSKNGEKYRLRAEKRDYLRVK